ncbi:MAG: DUF4376 domain-containing protein [Rhodospirillaceae bacterium]|nr:MAG: DUF4376 domain-containing protein [Rhodospirillaceae bacterium]
MRHALILAATNVVANVIELAKPDDFPLADGLFVVQSDTASIGQIWDAASGTFSNPPVDVVPPSKADLLENLAAQRWEIETGGMQVNGVRIATDDRSKSLINGTKAYLDANPAETVRFKSEAGWLAVDLATITAIFNALGAHIQACFAAEEAVGLRIEAGELITVEAVDAALLAEIASRSA